MSLTKDSFRSMEAAAKRAAAKICGIGQCSCAYDCEHTNMAERLMPHIDTKKKCPLARYDIHPEKSLQPLGEHTSKELEVTEDDIFTLCACCPHSSVWRAIDGTIYVRRANEFDANCLDCPVKAAAEAIQERGVEH